MDAQHPPLLKGFPDGHRAPIPLIPAPALPFVALILGIVPCTVVFLGMAGLLRRPKLMALAMALGAVGLLLPLPFLVLGPDTNWALAGTVIRILAAALGLAMYRLIEKPLIGHSYLGGTLTSMSFVCLPAMALSWVLPWSVRVWMEMPLLAVMAEP